MAKRLRGKASGGIGELTRDLGQMIEKSRHQVVHAANAAMTALYWEIGERIRTEVLEDKRAAYGQRVVLAVGRKLEAQYGRGFGEKSLRRTAKLSPHCGDNWGGRTSESSCP